MLHTALSRETNEFIIRGEFFELDQIYFLIERLTGNYGIDGKCPLPEYKTALSLLLSLNYEIRQAQTGNREIYAEYNGIRDAWIAPAGTPAESIKRPAENPDPEEIIREIEDDIEFELDMDLEDFYDKDEDDQRELLDELFLDPDHVDTYLKWLNRDPIYYFPHEDCPNDTGYNASLQFRVTIPEGILYMLIVRELLKHKEEILENLLVQADSEKEGNRDYSIDFCLRRARPELLLLESLEENLFSDLYSILGREDYLKFRNKEAPKDFLKNWTEADIHDVEKLVAEYRTADPDNVMHVVEGIYRLTRP